MSAYPPPPPAQGLQQGPPPQQYGAPQNTTVVIQQQAAVRPASYLGLAIFSCLCCNAFCGIAAIVLSVMSSSSADDGDLEGARFKGKFSLGLSLAGMISTVLIIVIVVVYLTVLVSDTVDAYNDAYDSTCYYGCDSYDTTYCNNLSGYYNC